MIYLICCTIWLLEKESYRFKQRICVKSEQERFGAFQEQFQGGIVKIVVYFEQFLLLLWLWFNSNIFRFIFFTNSFPYPFIQLFNVSYNLKIFFVCSRFIEGDWLFNNILFIQTCFDLKIPAFCEVLI